MRLLSLPLFLTLSLFATGCASFGEHHSINEAQVEDYLQQQLRDFDRQLQAGGIMSLDLQRAKVTLGPDNREVAVLDFAGRATVDAFLARVPVDIAFRVEGAPVYDSDERAVFIRDLKLLDSRITSGMGAMDLTPYGGMITEYAAMFLDNNPVYRLDEDDFGQRMFGMMNMGIKVKPGRLTMVPGGRRQ